MDDVIRKRLGIIISVAYYGLILVAFYLVFKTFFGVLLPFIAAFLIAAALHRPVKFVTGKTPLNRTLVSTVFVLLILGVFGVAVFFLGNYVVAKLKSFYEFILLKTQDFTGFVEQVRNWSVSAVSFLPEKLRTSVVSAMTEFFDKLAGSGLREMTSSLSFDWGSLVPKGVGMIRNTVGQIPSIVIGFVISIVACVFLTIDYDRIMDFIHRQFSPQNRKKLSDAKTLAKSTLGKMGKAYGLIILITTVEVSVGLYIMKFCKIYTSDYILLISFIIALIDIIPVLGTGTVLIPWAVYSFFTGSIPLGIGLIVMYVVILVIRQIIEPKLVAGQVGMPPIITIAAMYVGTKTLGVLGFFIMPFCVILIKKFNDEGIIHIFKTKRESASVATAAETAVPDAAVRQEESPAAE